MLLAKKAIDDILRCSFCHAKFEKIIKLIPDCGSSICGKCHYELAREMNPTTSEYVCKECNQLHILPENGLAANKFLEKMLSMQGEGNPTSQKAEALKKLIDEIQAKINELNADNVQQRVDAYCEALAKQVTDAIDAAFNHLNKLGNQLLEQINEYRASLLDTDPENRPSKRFKSSELSVQEELEKLTKEFQDFSSASSFALSSSNMTILSTVEESLLDYKDKVDKYAEKHQSSPFNSRSMRYEANRQFCNLTDHLGALLVEELDAVDQILDRRSPDIISLETQFGATPAVKVKVLNSFVNHTRPVRQVAFLFDGDLASCSDDKTIKVWDHQSGKMLYELKETPSKILAMAPMTSSLLACSSKKTIYIWDLNNRKIIKKLKGHDDVIFSLKRLDNGNLISVAFDDTIKIWNPYQTNQNLRMTMRGHGVVSGNDLVIMSNGQLATCSNNTSMHHEPEFLRLWDTDQPEWAKRFRTTLHESCCLAAMRGERVAVGFHCGRIIVFNTYNVNRSILMKRCHEKGVYSLLEAPNGLLISGGSWVDPSIKLWDAHNGTLVQTITTGQNDCIHSLSLSRDGRLLASGSHDGTVTVISVDFFDSK